MLYTILRFSSYNAVSERFQFDELSFSECDQLSKIFTVKIVLPTSFFPPKTYIFSKIKN